MNGIVIARYGEVHLKSGNRKVFLALLLKNLASAVGDECKVKLEDGRFVITGGNLDEVALRAANVFGITSTSPVAAVAHDKILEHIDGIKIEGTFRVTVNRANKNFPHKSTDFSAICGERILKNNKGARVDLTAPKTEVSIDIRDGIAYVYDKVFVGVGGLPVGSSGKALCFLSGGIDSPVAAYLAAKRGLSVDFVHFATPPYTSTAAIDKVKRLVKILTQYGCGNKLRVVNITEPMTLIRERRDKQYTITLMRRLMVRIATLLCAKGKYDCIITGENLAQVASQTVKGIASNDCVASKIPILRPLITYDKNEIISVARRIGTYNISIEPHADCCTVFVPESPIISPTIERCEREESIIDKEQYKPSGDKYNILTIASTSEIIIV